MKQLNHPSWYFLVPWISWVTTTFHYFTSAKQALGSCSEDDIAVRVLMRVIGAYPKKNLLLVDSCLGNSKMISEVSWFFFEIMFFSKWNLFCVFFCKDLDGLQLLRIKVTKLPSSREWELPGRGGWTGGWTVHKRLLDFHELLCPEKHLELFFFGL